MRSRLAIRILTVVVAVLVIAKPALAKPRATNKPTSNTIQANGKVELSQNQECRKDAVCYVITGSIKIDRIGEAKLSGEGTVNPSTCHPNASEGMCCKDSLFVIAEISKDTAIDFTISGLDCTRAATEEILKASAKITGGTGRFQGASGAGTATMNIDPELGNGTISIAATLK